MKTSMFLFFWHKIQIKELSGIAVTKFLLFLCTYVSKLSCIHIYKSGKKNKINTEPCLFWQ